MSLSGSKNMNASPTEKDRPGQKVAHLAQTDVELIPWFKAHVAHDMTWPGRAGHKKFTTKRQLHDIHEKSDWDDSLSVMMADEETKIQIYS